MKKLSLIIFTLVLALTSNSIVSAAAEQKPSKEKVIYKSNEITNIEHLYKNAKAGKSDLEEEIYVSDGEIIDQETGDTQETEVISTTQLLEEKQIGEATVSSYATTSFSGADRENYVSELDTSLGVKAYSRIYYDVKKVDNIQYFKLVGVTGGWTRQDSSISMSGRKYQYGSTGWTENNGYKNQYSTMKSITSNSFSASAPSSWGYINEKFQHSIGVTTYITLKRGTRSSWQLKLSNQLKLN